MVPPSVSRWNGEGGQTETGYLEPPALDYEEFILKDTDDYSTVGAISRRLNKILRHQTGKAKVVGSSGRQHEIPRCNEGGWVSISDVLMYGHIFNDNSNRITRDAERPWHLDAILTTRYRRCCQAMW